MRMLEAGEPTRENPGLIPKEIDEALGLYAKTHAYWLTIIDLSDPSHAPHGMSNMPARDVIKMMRFQADALERRLGQMS